MIKRIYITITIFSIQFWSFSQAPNFKWAKVATEYTRAFSTGISADEFGNSYNIGYFYDSIKFEGTRLYGDNMYLTKHDSLGNIIWAKTFPNTNFIWPYKIVNDQLGNIYFAGIFEGNAVEFETATLIGSAYYDAFLVKCDPNGSVLWAKSYTGPNDEQARDLAIDNENNVILVGEFDSPSININGVHSNSHGMGDIFIAKYDSNGSLLFTKTEGTADYENINAITIDENNNFFLAGGFSGSSIKLDTIEIQTQASSNMYLAKYNSLGNISWLKTILSDSIYSENVVSNLNCDKNGEICLSGYFVGGELTTNNLTISSSNGGLDFFIIKYSNSGEALWGKTGGGARTDVSYNISTDNNNNIFLSGVFNSSFLNFDGISLQGDELFNQKGFVFKIKPSGEVVWGFKLDGSDLDDGLFLKSYGNGNIIISGSFEDSCDFDPDQSIFNINVSENSKNVFVMKITDPEFLSIFEINSTNLIFYPNPTKDFINVTLNSKHNNISYKLLSLTGALLNENVNLYGDQLIIDLSKQNAGIYLLELKINGQIEIIKLIKN